MPPTVQQIKEQLLKAIDEDANVVDLVAVVEVISTLEKYPVTKEALEETRLGKLVNEIRRKTNNDDLSKRCRKLVKLWQNLCIPQTPNANRLTRSASAVPLNGSSISTSAQKTKGNKTPDVRPSTSQALGKTYTADRKKRRAAESTSNSPDVPPEKKIALSSSTRLHTSHSDSDLVNGLPSGSEVLDAKGLVASASTISSSVKPRTSTPKLPSASHSSSKGSPSPRLHSVSPRLQSLHSKPATPVLQSQIHKSDSSCDLKSKTVARTPTKGQELERSVGSACEDFSHQDTEGTTEKSRVEPVQRSKHESIHIHSESQLVKKCDEEHVSDHVEQAEGVAKRTEQTPPVTPRKPVTSEEVDRLHSENWEGVNGCCDSQSQWHDWGECLQMNTFDDNVLHILPYVVLE